MKSSRANDTRRVLVWQFAVGLAALTTWQTLVSLNILDAFFVSRPTDIAQRVATWIATGTLWGHLATTLEESLLGLLVGSALGIALGFGLGRAPFLAAVCDPYIKMLNAVPRVVLADRKSTRLNSSHQIISYAVFCLKKKKT